MHTVPVIGQRRDWLCWLASFSMLYSWKENRTVTMGEMAKVLGGIYETRAINNQGLSASEASQAIATLGMTLKGPFNPTVSTWVEFATKTPLMVVVREAHFGIHARVVTNIKQVPSSSLGEVSYNDPAGNSLAGSAATQGLREFVKYFEQLAGTGFLGVQIAGWF